MADFGVQKPWEPPKTNASKSRSRTEKRQRKQKALRIEAGTHLPLVWALPDGVAPPELSERRGGDPRAFGVRADESAASAHDRTRGRPCWSLYPLKRQPVEERAPRRRGQPAPSSRGRRPTGLSMNRYRRGSRLRSEGLGRPARTTSEC